MRMKKFKVRITAEAWKESQRTIVSKVPFCIPCVMHDTHPLPYTNMHSHSRDNTLYPLIPWHRENDKVAVSHCVNPFGGHTSTQTHSCLFTQTHVWLTYRYHLMYARMEMDTGSLYSPKQNRRIPPSSSGFASGKRLTLRFFQNLLWREADWWLGYSVAMCCIA